MRKLPFLLILLAVLAVNLPADQRTEPIDVIVALDKSLSMEEEIKAVIDYVNSYVIDQLLIVGDYFVVVAFYGKAEVPVALKITGPQDKEKAKKAVAELVANGRFTDIGNALDALGAEVAKLGETGRKKHLLLITDGIQEAPPASRYYSRDGKFSHEFLENAKTVQKKGWKIQILGIGTQAESQQLAETLAAQYTELSAAPTVQEFIDSTQGFLAGVEAAETATLSPVDYLGYSRLSLNLRSKGYTEPARVDIGEIRLSLAAAESPSANILPRPATLEVPPDAPLGGSLRVRLPDRLPAGVHEGTLEFVFTGEGRFTPVVMPVSFQVKSLFASYWYLLIAAAVIVVALVVLLVVLVARPGRIRSRFRLVVEGKKRARGDQVFTLVEGAPLFLDEAAGSVQIARSKSPASLARLTPVRGGVRLTVLRSEKFPPARILPPNVLDHEFKVRIEAKKSLTVTLASVK
jgi:hypothetical protein